MQVESQQGPTPISRFARFFRSYGIALGVIVAAIPLATKMGSLLPIYNATKDILTFSTSLLSLLAIAILFGVRRSIGQAVFPHAETRCISESAHRTRKIYGTVWPITLAVLAIAALVAYLVCFSLSILDVADEQHVSITGTKEIEWILAETPLVRIGFLAPIAIAYVTMFLAAAAAFVWLGLIEYIQNDLGISDSDLITKPYTLMTRQEFKLAHDVAKSEAAAYFCFEYDPRNEQPVPLVSGPFCGQHHWLLRYDGKVAVGRHRWKCVNPVKEKDQHFISFPYDTVDAAYSARDEANRLLQARLNASGIVAGLK
ncbi:MAG: hypothetical protein MN733_04530 [Nitrososphaera sp.]|nr:hypothetical protein [Nitrososphaera sp.]